MKKFFFLLLIGVAVAVTPGFFGRFAEKEYRQAIEQLSVHPLVNLNTLSYERNWYRTRVVTAMELKIPVSNEEHGEDNGLFAEPLRIELIHDVVHGPLIYGGDAIARPALFATTTRMRLTGKAQELVTRIYGEQEPLTIDSVSPFFGEHRVRFALAGMTYTDADSGITVNMQPATGDWLVASDLASSRGTLSWPGLTGGFAKGGIEIEGFNYVFDMKKLNDYIWIGNGALDMGRLDIRVSGGFEFGLTDLHMDSDIQEQEGLLHGRGGMALSRLMVNDLEYGPAAYSVQLRHVDAAAVSDFYAWQYAMYGQMQGASPEELALIHEQFGEYLLALLPQVLKKGPELEIADLSISMPAGEITGAVKVSIDNSQPELLEQLATVPYAVHADFRLGIPRALLINSQVEPQMNVWLTAGLLEEQDEVILLRGRFAHGHLMLNGNPLPQLLSGGN
jgi:uncharacterized protein YdgA (DUF945 family)